MSSPRAILSLASLTLLPFSAVARSVGPFMLPRQANTTISDGLIHPEKLSFSVDWLQSAEGDYGHVDGLLDGFHYLMTRDGKPGNDPNSCGRISCSADTTIQWCNKDANNRKELDSYQVTARAVMEIFKQKSCWQSFDGDNYMDAWIKGEAHVEGSRRWPGLECQGDPRGVFSAGA
ncbi:hypothetical protein B0T09DRAFT_320936 [Sordaria sp. MPI-SDFR-AT-0083]|nr:hypothetical protein B0T09DRAFT_320936 [Sordaria sp. MPI-SDFR-AT-0083]